MEYKGKQETLETSQQARQQEEGPKPNQDHTYLKHQGSMKQETNNQTHKNTHREKPTQASRPLNQERKDRDLGLEGGVVMTINTDEPPQDKTGTAVRETGARQTTETRQTEDRQTKED